MTKSTLTIDYTGNLKWFNDKGEYHREEDKPAIIHSDGTKKWLVDGKLHRDNDKPAVIWSDGYKSWWVNGKFIKDSNCQIDFNN